MNKTLMTRFSHHQSLQTRVVLVLAPSNFCFSGFLPCRATLPPGQSWPHEGRSFLTSFPHHQSLQRGWYLSRRLRLLFGRCPSPVGIPFRLAQAASAAMTLTRLGATRLTSARLDAAGRINISYKKRLSRLSSQPPPSKSWSDVAVVLCHPCRTAGWPGQLQRQPHDPR